ncbi:MAG: cupin domain-containing protein [Pseudomonadota bacterium]
MKTKINLAEKMDKIEGYYAPGIIADYNDNEVFLAKFKGAFPWHAHADTDDLFLVIRGEVDIEMRDRTVTLGPGELFVVPKGVEHRPVAREEAHVLLIEPRGEPNTGDAATATPKVRI